MAARRRALAGEAPCGVPAVPVRPARLASRDGASPRARGLCGSAGEDPQLRGPHSSSRGPPARQNLLPTERLGSACRQASPTASTAGAGRGRRMWTELCLNRTFCLEHLGPDEEEGAWRTWSTAVSAGPAP